MLLPYLCRSFLHANRAIGTPDFVADTQELLVSLRANEVSLAIGLGSNVIWRECIGFVVPELGDMRSFYSKAARSVLLASFFFPAARAATIEDCALIWAAAVGAVMYVFQAAEEVAHVLMFGDNVFCKQTIIQLSVEFSGGVFVHESKVVCLSDHPSTAGRTGRIPCFDQAAVCSRLDARSPCEITAFAAPVGFVH